MVKNSRLAEASATPNVIVTINENGELWPNVVDVGFIKNPPVMRQVHEKMLAQSVLREYRKMDGQHEETLTDAPNESLE